MMMIIMIIIIIINITDAVTVEANKTPPPPTTMVNKVHMVCANSKHVFECRLEFEVCLLTVLCTEQE